MVTLPLTTNKKQWLYIIIVLVVVFLFNLLNEYIKFKDFKDDEIYVATVQVINIYPKKHHQILKLTTSKANFTFFTKTHNETKLQIYDNIEIYINTQNVTFFKFIKGFYTTSFNIQKLKSVSSLKQNLSYQVSQQHSDNNITSLFNALFFATSINQDLRKICATFGVSHLIAISGFHLGILSLIIYWLLYYPYFKIQSKYFPYRNKKFDLLIVTTIILFFYLIFTGIVPSLLRAFVMLVFGIYFLRTNIKILSFGTLALVVMFIVAFFPKLLFSISLWFSVSGVFYIFLFLQYFKNMNKILAFFFFNIWIYLAINPITHFVFGTTSLAQLYSPLFTMGFMVFYPLELFLHFIGYGNILDDIIKLWLNLEISSQEIFTPIWVFISYVIISLFSIFYNKWFITLNLSLIIFNLWLYIV